MTYSEAEAIFKAMQASCGEDALLQRHAQDVVLCATAYARIRTDCRLAARARREQLDGERTARHDQLIEACNALGQHQAKQGADTSWRRRLGRDRRTIGDFGCFIHCILGIEAR